MSDLEPIKWACQKYLRLCEHYSRREAAENSLFKLYVKLQQHFESHPHTLGVSVSEKVGTKDIVS